MSEHDRFEELASLAAIGELSHDEFEEFRRHKVNCSQCHQAFAQTTAIAATAFLAGSRNDGDPAVDDDRHRRLRQKIAQRLHAVVPVSFAQRYKHLVAAGIAAAFLLGAGVGTAIGRRVQPVSKSSSLQMPTPAAVSPTVALPVATPAAAADESIRLQTAVADLQRKIEEARADNRSLREKLASSDQRAVEVETRLDEVEKRSNIRVQEAIQTRNELNATRGELS